MEDDFDFSGEEQKLDTTKLKPFNLAEALEGKKVVTRNGQMAARVFHAPELGVWREVLVVFHEDSYTRHYSAKGQYDGATAPTLFMAPEIREGWIGVYDKSPDRDRLSVYVYPTEEAARKDCQLATTFVKITYQV